MGARLSPAMRTVLLVFVCGVAACGRPTGSTFAQEAPGLVAALTDDPNHPLAREESWERSGPGTGDRTHCSWIESPASPPALRPRIQAWAGAGAGASQAGFTRTGENWSHGALTVSVREAGGETSRVSVCKDYAPATAAPRRETFLLTGLTQLDFGEAKAVLDSQGLTVAAITRAWSPEGGATVTMVTAVSDRDQSKVRTYLESARLLEPGEDASQINRPDGSRITTLVQPANGSGDAVARITLAVQQPADRQLW